MIDGYKLVAVNIFLLVILGIVFYVYTNVFPKKRIHPLAIIFLVSLLPVISILRKGTYESGDLSLHTIGSLAFYNSLFQGNLHPVWAEEINVNYGSPHHLIMYYLPRFSTSIIHYFGVSILNSVKSTLIVTYILSGIGMYLWANEQFRSKIAALTAGIFYLYAPYHLLDLHFRVATGELFAFALVPFNFLFTKLLIDRNEIRWFFLQIVFLALLILSHQAISLSAFFFLAIYSAIEIQSKKARKIPTAITVYLSYLLGILLCGFYWIPLLMESNYTVFSKMHGVEFLTLQELLYSPWRYGLLFQGPTGQLSFIVGYSQIIVIGIALFYLFSKTFKAKNLKLLLYFLASFGILFISMQSVSKVLWENIPLISNFQSTYRLLIMVAFFTAAIAGLISTKLNSKILMLVIILCMASTILNWGNRRNIPTIKDDSYFANRIKYYINENGGIDYAQPKWVDRKKINLDKPPKNNVEVVSGRATYSVVDRNSTNHIYVFNVREGSIIKENTFYFPGWNLYVNNQQKLPNYSNQKFPGVINFPLSKGIHIVELKFENTNSRKLGYMVSIVTLIILTVIGIIFIVRRYKIHVFHKRL